MAGIVRLICLIGCANLQVGAQTATFLTRKEQQSCHKCIAEGKHMCKLGGFPRLVDGVPLSDRHDAQSQTQISYRYTGYGQNYGARLHEDEEGGTNTVYRAQKCCADSKDCDGDGKDFKPLAFCSNKAKTNAMKYTFCDYQESVCMESQSLLTPSYVGRQISGSTPGLFYTNSSCYW